MSLHQPLLTWIGKWLVQEAKLEHAELVVAIGGIGGGKKKRYAFSNRARHGGFCSLVRMYGSMIIAVYRYRLNEQLSPRDLLIPPWRERW